MGVRQVKTDMDPEFVNNALLSTFQKWIEFSMGLRRLGGRKLKNPSGKMAAALRADRDKDGNIVALYIDPEAEGADSNQFVMGGHKRVYLKKTMLRAGKKGVHISDEGYLYRYIPIANKPKSPSSIWAEAEHLKSMLTTRKTSTGSVVGINKNLAKMWLSSYSKAHAGERKIRVMSNKPGSARWEIPAMKPFSVGKLLRDMLSTSKLKGRVII